MIGPAISRIDGPLKVTGQSAYAYERQDAGSPLYVFVLGATIGKGRIARIDTSAADNSPGVRLVMTHLNAPQQGPYVFTPDFSIRPHPQLTSDKVEYFGEPVAFVVAATFEQARSATALVSIDYDREPGAFDLAAHADKAIKPETISLGLPAEMRFGDIDRAMAEGPVIVDQNYETPYHFSQAMEPPARLAATKDGRLTAVGHDVNMQAFAEEPWIEQAATVVRSLYAAPNRLTRHYITNLDIKAAEAVRGPGELPGLLALETAMDELAVALDIDPLQLRLTNDTDVDPELGVPLNGRRLADCLKEGARRFGWDRRPTRPASRREGRQLIGYGLASAIRMHFQGPTDARVRVEGDGRIIVESDMTDIGTGARTIAAQIAAEALVVPVERVTVKLANSNLPKSPGAGGSWGASNVSIAIDRACQSIKEKIAKAASASAPSNDMFEDVRRYFPEGVEAIGQADDPNFKNYSQNTYGAAFAEVGVDVYTGEVRLRRMTGVFAAGRIINAKTARSQLIGGMIWGVSSALYEAAHVDPRYGNWVNGDLAEYVVPVHADIPAIEAIMLDDFDEHANHLGIKGIGELGVCGTGAAVANALFNATGVRVRNFPITMDKLLPALPPA